MTLRFIGVDPESPNNGSPTVWLDEDDGSIVIQGWKVSDERTMSEITAVKPVAHNIAAGEDVRWLPRHRSSGVLVPPADFWLFDGRIVLWNHFAGDGSWVGEEQADDEVLAMLCKSSFDAAWHRAIPHSEYKPA
jgi:hypothetical protein